MPVICATIVGPDTNAYESLVMITRSQRPISNAGPDTAGPCTIAMLGTTPEQRLMARAA